MSQQPSQAAPRSGRTDPTPANSDRAGGYVMPGSSRPCRPPRSESRARSQLINIRVSADERERWAEFARAKGLPLGALLRLSIEAVMADDAMREVAR